VKARACEASRAATQVRDRGRIASLTCEQLPKETSFASPNVARETRTFYVDRLAECGQWEAFFSLPQHGSEASLVREAKTPKGEAGLRAAVLRGSQYNLPSMVENLEVIDKASGPVVADELASSFDRVAPPDRQPLFEYLAKHRHPKAKALIAEYLASADQYLRRSGCWGASQVGDADFRPRVQELATNDTYSVVERFRNGTVSQTFVVRDECREALSKLPPR
jgi:hypothetical protein